MWWIHYNKTLMTRSRNIMYTVLIYIVSDILGHNNMVYVLQIKALINNKAFFYLVNYNKIHL